MRRRVCTARGAALVETVTALALISLTVVTMLSGFAGTMLMASRHRTQTRLDLVIRSDVETIKGQPYSATASYSLPAPPAPFTSATFTVLYYNPTGCGGFCATAPSPDSGLQWLTITVNGPGVSETVSLFKEKL
jgi:hypothetical protein